MKFNEDSRVKIPAILHLTRLGYTYLSLKNLVWDESSNIVPSIFRTSVSSINPTATQAEIENALAQIDLFLDNEDLGKQLYGFITETSGLQIIDFEDFRRNSLLFSFKVRQTGIFISGSCLSSTNVRASNQENRVIHSRGFAYFAGTFNSISSPPWSHT